MTATALAAALLTGTVAPAAAAARSQAAHGAGTGQDRPRLQKALQDLADLGLAGVQLRVHDEQGDWAGSAGVRKLGQTARPPTNGRFWAGSVNKTLTATLVLQLVAESKIELDDPVADHLPELGLDQRITVRMMLRHTTGLFNYTGDFDANGQWEPGIPGHGEEWLANRFHSYRPEELLRLALSKKPRFEPGTDQRYANTNYTLALLLIEKVTGHSYAEEMRRRILGPLGMRNTVIPGDRTQLPGPYAHGYFRYQEGGQWKVVDVSRQNPSLLAGAGALISTTQDLQTFISALMGGKLLPAPLLAEMRKPYGDLGYGLGLWVQDLGPGCGGIVYQHNGSPPAGYGALMYSSPDGRKTLTASLTTGDAAVDPAALYPRVVERLLKEVFCGGKTAR
ncbi:serine hydrolase domain-containing protein [Streptosporangium sp. NPDC001559]|uniref:serine hydrolase domain-containing protein n=1 Tax=Streptosporangium sp. NPDC001559 TaxID=3366187 RepID=UPI0036EE2028